MKTPKTWSVYFILCDGQAIYTGITTDVARRLRQHKGELVGGAKFTQRANTVELLYHTAVGDRSLATKTELKLKKLSHAQKRAIARQNLSTTDLLARLNLSPSKREKQMINLTSDTETKPTKAMRQAIATAEVGDEQKGKDPSVNALQERVAALLGKEAALFLPTGTMCNLIAIKTHTRPGDAIFAERLGHIIRAETAGAAVVSGVLIEAIESDGRGIFTPEALDTAVKRVSTIPAPYGPPPRLLCLEQTHNFGGGTVWSLAELKAVTDHGRGLGLASHMDGARLMNAVVASGTPAAEFGACVDTLWLDFTKGLGAPMGAVLAGSQEFIARARQYKHMFGGAMRQAGIAAAGCLYALDHHIERLAEDHAHAQRLADGLRQIDGLTVLTPQPETNMVYFHEREAGIARADFLHALKEEGVLMGSVGADIRVVTHLDVSAEDIEVALTAVEKVVQRLS